MAQSNRTSPASEEARRRGAGRIGKEPRQGVSDREAEEIQDGLPPSGAPTEDGLDPEQSDYARPSSTNPGRGRRARSGASERQGITNHPAVEEKTEQEQLPPRGEKKR